MRSTLLAALVLVGGLFGVIGHAQAITISGLSAVFDNPNDRLKISGTVTSTDNGTFNEFAFDWDGPLDSFDFTGGSVLSSNLPGATLFFPAGAVSGGAFAVTGLSDAPFSAPQFFDFVFQLPPAPASFLTEDIDIGVCDDCSPDFVDGEVLDQAVVPVAGNLIPEPTALALAGLCLSSLAVRRTRCREKSLRVGG